jgi:hypothetical protein
METSISYETLLDAARRHFLHVGGSAQFTRAARHHALGLARQVEEELASANAGHPRRLLLDVPPQAEALRAA